jgi:hypothetical protein
MNICKKKDTKQCISYITIFSGVGRRCRGRDRMIVAFTTTNKTDHHDIAEILLKVVLKTIELVLRYMQFDLPKN